VTSLVEPGLQDWSIIRLGLDVAHQATRRQHRIHYVLHTTAITFSAPSTPTASPPTGI